MKPLLITLTLASLTLLLCAFAAKPIGPCEPYAEVCRHCTDCSKCKHCGSGGKCSVCFTR